MNFNLPFEMHSTKGCRICGNCRILVGFEVGSSSENAGYLFRPCAKTRTKHVGTLYIRGGFQES